MRVEDAFELVPELICSVVTSFEATDPGEVRGEDPFELVPEPGSFGEVKARAGGALLYLEGGYDTCIELV